MKFLNKLYGKAIFSEDAGLNVTAYDLGEDMITISFDEPATQRLKTATGTVGSLNIFVPAKVELHILKTSPVYTNYRDRILNNSYLGGTLTIYDDVNESHEIEEISLSINEIPTNGGSQPSVVFVVEGNLRVNKQALAGF